MKESSVTKIEIGGKEYSLFLNRSGIVAWEKYSKEENQKLRQLANKSADIIEAEEITDETNPFENIDEVTKELESDNSVVTKSFKKLYWIMLYTYHKLSLNEASKLYDDAVKEYGEAQLVQLGEQIVEEINVDPNATQNLKNLAALKPTKK